MTGLTTARTSPSSSRRPRVAIALLVALGTMAGAAALAEEPAFMSGDWGVAACAAWNQDPVLTTELAKNWIKNDKGRGHKVLQLYRSDCGDKPTVELRISLVDGKAHCSYGGPYREAMGNMGPFGSFLLLAGKVEGSETCP